MAFCLESWRRRGVSRRRRGDAARFALALLRFFVECEVPIAVAAEEAADTRSHVERLMQANSFQIHAQMRFLGWYATCKNILQVFGRSIAIHFCKVVCACSQIVEKDAR